MDPLMIVLIVVISVVAILAIAAVLFFILKKKNSKSLVNEPFILSLELALGSKNNIQTIEVIQGRLHITVTDLELVKLDDIKKLAEKGVFVTGNTIKVLFKDDSKLIKDALEK